MNRPKPYVQPGCRIYAPRLKLEKAKKGEYPLMKEQMLVAGEDSDN